MNVDEFVNAVIPTVGERCGDFGCCEWADHACVDWYDYAGGRCVAHCVCVNDNATKPNDEEDE